MRDPKGTVLTSAVSPPVFTPDDFVGSITMATTGSKKGIGATGRRPCLTNGEWDTPYTWDAEMGWLAFAVPQSEWDPDWIHCAPLSFDGIDPPQKIQDTCTLIVHMVPVEGTSQVITCLSTTTKMTTPNSSA